MSLSWRAGSVSDRRSPLRSLTLPARRSVSASYSWRSPRSFSLLRHSAAWSVLPQASSNSTSRSRASVSRTLPCAGILSALGGGSEEMAAAVPVLGMLGVHQAEVGLVDQRGCLQRLPRPLLGQLLGRQLAQLLVDQRQQLAGRVGAAVGDGVEHLRDVARGGIRGRPCSATSANPG